MTVCTCIRDPRDVRRVAVQDPYCQDRERRDNLARIPDTITDLSRAYTASGGDAADLVDALSPEQVAALGT